MFLFKRSDVVLRSIFYLCARAARDRNPLLRDYTLRRGNLKGKELYVALTRKLARVTWAV